MARTTIKCNLELEGPRLDFILHVALGASLDGARRLSGYGSATQPARLLADPRVVTALCGMRANLDKAIGRSRVYRDIAATEAEQAHSDKLARIASKRAARLADDGGDNAGT